jgi:hypothetical protein
MRESVGPIFGFVIRILAQFDSCYVSYMVIFFYGSEFGFGNVSSKMWKEKGQVFEAKTNLPDMITGV